MADSASDFFEYGRGFALYSQGITDVGRKFQKDPITGKEVTAPEPELIQAAIERDTLMLAKMIGPDLTLTEYKNLHDQVAFLQQQYRDQKITNAIYQEKLWSLPDRTKKERSQKKSTHYAPSRDAKTGEPKARPLGTDVTDIPVETMQKLSPDMGNMPEVNFKEFWDSVVAEAADRSSGGGNGAQPTGEPRPLSPSHSDVGIRPGAQPVVSADSSVFSVPAPSGKRGGLLDQLQAGLDTIGIVEPTPFADGINAGISAVRALASRPSEAGTHLRNAGVSLLSAVVPYIGDTAKLARYGEKVDLRSAPGKLLRTLGILAGDGSGGDVGSAGIFGGNGGSSGGSEDGTTPNGSNPIGGLVSSVAGGFMNLGRAMGPIGITLVAATFGVKKFIEWMGKVDQASRKTIEDNRSIAQYSGGMSASYMRLDAERTLRDIDRARDVSGPMGRLTRAQSFSEQAQQDALRGPRKAMIDLQATMSLLVGATHKVAENTSPLLIAINAFYEAVELLKRNSNAEEAEKKRKEIEKERQDLRDHMAAKGHGIGRHIPR